MSKKTHTDVTRMTTQELLDTLSNDLHWLASSSGRLQKLIDIRAPELVLTNERACWDSKVSRIKAILADGQVKLNEAGERAWRKALKDYCTLPDLQEVLDKFSREREDSLVGVFPS